MVDSTNIVLIKLIIAVSLLITLFNTLTIINFRLLNVNYLMSSIFCDAFVCDFINIFMNF